MTVVRWREGLGALALLVAVAACETTDGERAAVVGAGSGRVPYEKLSDWVSYADAVVVFRVVDEEVLPATAAETERGEGLIGRNVVVEVVDTLWQRPQGHRVPQSFTFATGGWVLKGDRQVPLLIEDAARLEPDASYLAPVALFPDLGWSPIDATATLPFIDGAVRAPEAQGDVRAFAEVDRRSASEIRALLETARPYPAAAANAELDPDERFAMVREAGG